MWKFQSVTIVAVVLSTNWMTLKSVDWVLHVLHLTQHAEH